MSPSALPQRESKDRNVADVQSGAAYFDVARFLPDPDAAKLLPRGVAGRYMAAPLAVDDTTIRVAMTDPSDLEALDYVEMVTHRRPIPVPVGDEQLRELIHRIYGSSSGGPEDLAATVEEAIQLARESAEGTELPIVRL
ncbi:MAG: hypothetical protein GF355_04755, partial [Candidatus Eisenbacteria bacterium]|nr:hypothetical protein [Candidatus Eisenbacteria bacterium]